MHGNVSQKVHDVGGGNVEGHKLPQRLTQHKPHDGHTKDGETHLELLVGQSEAAHLEQSEHLQLVPGQAAGRHQLVRPGVRLHPN